jgi:hypothetical protein
VVTSYVSIEIVLSGLLWIEDLADYIWQSAIFADRGDCRFIAKNTTFAFAK